ARARFEFSNGGAMNRKQKLAQAVGAISLATLVTFPAMAQHPPAQPAPAPAPPAPAPEPPPAAPAPPPPAAPPQAQASGQAGVAYGAPTPPAGAAPRESDHHTVVRSLGVGFLGRRNMLSGNAIDPARADCPGGGAPCPIDVPVVGIRYWIDDLIGIDG